MRASVWLAVYVLLHLGPSATAHGQCRRAVFEGEVAAGKSYERVFTSGLKFLLEPIASGWIVRVLIAGEPRGPHDLAGLATPPYESVTALAVSTDFSFRAQDAVGWNPRRFRYVATPAEFRRMVALYGPAMRGDAGAETELVGLAAAQPQAELTILEAHLVPGANDQARTAAAVASHFQSTPHTVEQGTATPLGRITWMRFRVALDLAEGTAPAKAVHEETRMCELHPTTHPQAASQSMSPAGKN